MIKIKWLIHHIPTKLFTKTAENFQKHLDELTNKKFKIEIITKDGCDPLPELKNDRVQISEIYSNLLGKYGATDFYALILPCLFESRTHSDRVLQGEIGKKLLTHLFDRTGIHGLGFRWMEITKKFYPKIDYPRFYPTYPRYYPGGWWSGLMNGESKMQEHNPIINDMTDLVMSNILNIADRTHSMYLTTIVLNDTFMSTLSEQDKKHFYEVALRLSKKNKQDNVKIAEELTWNQEEITKLRNIWLPLYEKYENFFSFDLLDRIKKE